VQEASQQDYDPRQPSIKITTLTPEWHIDTLVKRTRGYESSTLIVLQRALLHGLGVYNIPSAHVRGRAVATNTFPSDAYGDFRATHPGGLFLALGACPMSQACETDKQGPCLA